MKNCKQCSKGFEIDSDFFKRIDVSEPTLCPNCRNHRRMMFRNDRAFYLRKCDKSGKQFVSIYHPDAPYKVYQQGEWYGDCWNAMDYGKEFDFSRGFFEQFDELMHEVPRLGIDIVNCENSDYCNYCGDDKNCYLDIAGEANEDSYFNLFVKNSRNVVDCTFVYSGELCYECINCYECYACQFSSYLENCSDCLYCFDLKGCKNCLFSNGLRNKEYYIFNEQKTKEEYEKYVADLNLGSFDQRARLIDDWLDFKEKNGVHKDAYLINCENCTGDDLKNCKNTFDSFNALNCEDCKYLYDVLDATDCSDLNYSLYKPELSYELISTLSMAKSAFSMASHYNNEVYYCDLTNNSSNLFGCIGLSHKKYCILNKQYTRTEYEELKEKIVEYMKKTGEWGEFLPVHISPFAYNETVAIEYYPMTREKALDSGFRWIDDSRDKVHKELDYVIADNIAEVDDEICKQVLICEESSKPYKIIPQELAFYRKQGLPVPRVCPYQRHLDRNELRNPRKLFDRKCTKCGVGVLSTFAPGREEKVYCEECYLKEVY